MEHHPTYEFSMNGGRCQSHMDEKSDLESQQRSTVVCERTRDRGIQTDRSASKI